MSSSLEKRDLIYERQFGFRNKHSTNHALILVALNIVKNNLITDYMLEEYSSTFTMALEEFVDPWLNHFKAIAKTLYLLMVMNLPNFQLNVVSHMAPL